MEKLQGNTLTPSWIGRWGQSSLKGVLVGVLFVPFGLTLILPPQTEREPSVRLATSETKKSHPRDLVRIYSVLKFHRPDNSDAEAWKIAETILEESSGYEIDPMLVLALIDVESKFQHAAVSPAGARGIMQILPVVAKALMEEIGLAHDSRSQGFRPEHLDDPILNIKLGVYYLHDLYKNFRSMNLTLMAYNFGPTEIRNRLANDIELSHDFASTVLSAYQKYKKSNQPAF